MLPIPAPIREPSANTMGMARMGLRCSFSVRAAETMEINAIIAPIDRSMLPETSTKVTPTALMMMKELSISMLRNT